MVNPQIFESLSELRKVQRFFDSIPEADFRIVKLDDIGGLGATPLGIAQAIASASQDGQKPVRFIMPGDFTYHLENIGPAGKN
ncbi:hypothetical protein HYS31_05690 [Candidatus Woesearchaeota archaeon]|nr:hypothetical protein [Candidatus Woesearchaeota archaeon]